MLQLKNSPRTGGFALLVTITLVAFLVLILVSLASFTRVETQVAQNTRQIDQARQNALLALSMAVGELQRLAGPDQRATATAEITGVAEDGARHWTGVWGNSRGSDDLESTPASLGWLVSGNEQGTFTASEGVADFGRITAAASGLDFLPEDAINLGSAAAVGALADDVTVGGKPARLLVGPGGVERAADYVAAPLIDISVAADTIPGLSGTEQTAIGRYAWWVGDEGVKARFNLVDRWASQATTPAERYHRLIVSQRQGIELASRDDSDGAQVFGPTLYNVEGGGATATAFREELAKVMMRPQASMLTGFQADPVRTALRWRNHDFTMHARGVLADQLRGGLRRDLTVLLDRPAAAWTGALRTSLEEASTVDGGVLRTADFKSSQLYSASSPYTMASISGPDGRSPVAASWEQVRSFYDYAKSVSGSVAAVTRTDSRMAVHPVVSRWGVAFDASAAVDGSGGTLHLFPHVVLWNPYNVAISGSYRVRMEVGSGVGANSWIYFVTPRRDTDGDPIAAPPFTVYYRERIAEDDSSRPGKYGNHSLEFTIPAVTIPAGEARVFTPSANAVYSDSGDNPLAEGYTTNLAFTRPVGHVFTPEQLQDTAVVVAGQGGSGGGTISVHLLDASGVDTLQMIDGVGIVGGQLNVDVGGAGANEVIGGNRIGSVEFKDLVASPVTGEPGSGRWGLSAICHMQDGNGRYNWLAQHNVRAPSVGHAWFEWAPASGPGGGFGAAANWATAPLLVTGTHWTIDLLGAAQPYTGPSRFPSTGVGRAVLFHLPRPETPVLSLGQLQHAALGFAASGQEPTYAFGNSYPSHAIAQNKLLQPNPNAVPTAPSHWRYSRGEPHMVDTSYLLNRALWDRFFFSGTPDVAEAELQGLIDDDEPLPNARLNRRTGATAADARDFDRSASTLLVDGAFNVNSTSVEAWTALFAGLRNVGVNPATGAAAALNGSPYVRTPHVTGGQSVSSATDHWAGYRALTDAQVRTLARAAVDEVRARGPFVSMADFVNRALVAYPDERGLSGALQAALDATSALNTAVLERVRPPTSDPQVTGAGELLTVNGHDYYLQNIHAPRRNTGNRGRAKAAMAPGFLSQADLLQALGPALSARSDTFVIRAYGEVLNPVLAANDPARVAGRAWCEAVVQRMPDYVDETGNAAEVRPVESGAVVLTQDNRRFGRRFQVVGFRWLSPSEI